MGGTSASVRSGHGNLLSQLFSLPLYVSGGLGLDVEGGTSANVRIGHIVILIIF